MKCLSSTSRENCAGDPGEEREVRASKALPTSRADQSIEPMKKYPHELIFYRKILSKFGEKWGYFSPFIP